MTGFVTKFISKKTGRIGTVKTVYQRGDAKLSQQLAYLWVEKGEIYYNRDEIYALIRADINEPKLIQNGDNHPTKQNRSARR